MVLQSLAPRVEHHEPANCGTQPFRIRRNLEECRRCGLKQEVVHHALVEERETGERLRYREDDVDVADREQLLLAPRHPRAVGFQDAIAMSAHDVGHLEGWPGHRL